MVNLGLRAANDDELETAGRSLLRALWEDSGLGSRNRHFEALERVPARHARREVRLCRALLAELRRGGVRVVAATADPGGARVELEHLRVRARRELWLSGEALELLLEQAGTEALREALAGVSPRA